MNDRSHPVTIAVAGGTGSGKTTISNAILERVGSHHIAYIPHDAYYKDLSDIPLDERRAINFDHPDALDTALMRRAYRRPASLAASRNPGLRFHHPPAHERRRSTSSRSRSFWSKGFSCWPKQTLRPLFDVKIFVDTDADIRFIRRLKRDIAERGRTADLVIKQYLNTVRPMHMEFVEPSKRYADVIIPEGGFNTVAIDMVSDRISSLLLATSRRP